MHLFMELELYFDLLIDGPSVIIVAICDRVENFYTYERMYI